MTSCPVSNSRIRIFRSCYLLAVVFSLAANTSSGQWKKLFDFGSPINVVYFKEFGSVPLDGFAAINGTSLMPDEVWRTLDGGNTWSLATISFITNQGYADAGCFTFKDSALGWFASHWDGPRSIYRTTDGGNNWSDI